MGGTGISTIFCTNSITPMKYIYPSTLSTNVSVLGNNQYGCELFIYNDKSSNITVGFVKGSGSGSPEASKDHTLGSKKMLHAILVNSSVGWYVHDI